MAEGAVEDVVALASAGLYVPFSLQVALGQDYLPSRVGTASGVTLGLTVSIGGLVSPALGRLADSTSLQTALAPLIAMPVLSRLLFRTLPEPAAPQVPARQVRFRGPDRLVPARVLGNGPLSRAFFGNSATEAGPVLCRR